MEKCSNHNQGSTNTTPRRSFSCAIPQVLTPTSSSSSSVYDRTISSGTYHHHQDHIAFQLESSLGNRCFVSELAQSVNKSGASDDVDSIKAKIIAHPQFFNLFEAYTECQKVGAPPHVLLQLEARKEEFQKQWQSQAAQREDLKDPELDRFMEAYYNMLVKCREELARPLEEAMEFMRKIESELNALGSGESTKCFYSGDDCEGDGSTEQEVQLSEIDHRRTGDIELKNHLLRKYGGYLSGLKKELSKNKKKGKLPKEAKHKLLSWWDLHYKWPYPSETEKAALAESTGLDQKQINNWFINQRKRHWKPSEDMQLSVMEDDLHPQNVALYVDGRYIGVRPYC